MSINLIKLCVGINSVEHLAEFRLKQSAEQKAAGKAAESRHVTRMTPRLKHRILDGGSLYWVIRGFIQVRQRILRLDEVFDGDGIRRCGIVMDPELIRTEWQARRPFQGWRYFDPKDAPRDLPPGVDYADMAEMPAAMRLELARLGLI